MSTGTETETKKAIDDTTWRRGLAPIDFKDEWLNKDRELYTLIILKSALGVALNTVNVVLGSDTLEKSSLRSFGLLTSGLLEFAMVTANRGVIDGAINQDDFRNRAVGYMMLYNFTGGLALFAIDAVLTSKLEYQPLPQVFPIAQVADYVVNPLVANVLYLPVAPVTQTIPNLQLVQKFVNGLHAITVIGGFLGVHAGLITTQIVNNEQKNLKA
jgi:hypothetical protein